MDLSNKSTYTRNNPNFDLICAYSSRSPYTSTNLALRKQKENE